MAFKHGLRNDAGANCYQNAVTQALSACPSFRDRINSSPHGKLRGCSKECCLCIMKERLDEAGKTGKSVGPPDFQKLLRGFGEDAAGRGVQQDAHEFLRILVALMDDDTKDLFTGAQQTAFSRPGPQRCPKHSNCDFQDLSLYIDGCKTASQAMEKYNRFNTDYRCDQCGATGEIAGQVQITSYPQILLIHFARFSPEKTRAGYRKNHQAVGYEETIDLG